MNVIHHIIKTQKNKGGKFLKKLWCCVGGEYYTRDNFVLSTGLIMRIGHHKEIRKLNVSSVSPSSEC